jgi:hypothetical protein
MATPEVRSRIGRDSWTKSDTHCGIRRANARRQLGLSQWPVVNRHLGGRFAENGPEREKRRSAPEKEPQPWIGNFAEPDARELIRLTVIGRAVTSSKMKAQPSLVKSVSLNPIT